MKERLTQRKSDGSVGISECRYYNYNDFQKIARKLAYYEDLEEQGRLIVSPCKVGDTVFVIYPGYEKEIERGIADEIIIDEYRNVRVLIVEPEANDGRLYRYRKPSEWGEFVFSTKEEAEQKLKERKED